MIILLTGMSQLNTKLTRELAKLGEAVDSFHPNKKSNLEWIEFKSFSVISPRAITG